MNTQPQEDIAAMSFEAAMQELESIVRRLETGDTSLEQSLKDYARGTALKTHCLTTLNHARLTVEKIMKDESSAIKTEPFDA